MLHNRPIHINNKQNSPANSIKLEESMFVPPNYQIKRQQIDLNSRERSNFLSKDNNLIGNMSNISQKITKETQRTNSSGIWKRISPSIHHEIPKYEQKIVYINNKAFIVSKSPSKASNSQSKVICLNSKSKNKNKTNNSNGIQQQTNIRYEQIVQKIPSVEQCLQRKIFILQSRIKQIQGQKQQICLTLSQQIKKLCHEKHQNIIRITQLEQKLSQICERYQNKEVEISQLYKKLQNQREQKQKIRQILNYETPVQKSITTHNFINLTLSQQVQSLQRENKTLKNELQALKQSIKTNICSALQFQPSIQENKKVTAQTPKQTLQKNDRVLQQSREIMQIDSQILNIEQLISNISQISDENKKLKQLVQQSKNQLQVKQALAVQTARIVQAIKNEVQHSNSIHQCHSKQESTSQGCSYKNCLQNIKEILTQIYQN